MLEVGGHALRIRPSPTNREENDGVEPFTEATIRREAMTDTIPRCQVTIANAVATFKWKTPPVVCLFPTTGTGLMPQECLAEFNNLR